MRLNKAHPRFLQMLEEATATPVPRLAFDLRELAEAYGVSYATIYRAYRRGALGVVRGPQRKLLVSAEEARRFLRENTVFEPKPGRKRGRHVS